MRFLLIVLLAVIIIYLTHRLLLLAEHRGWIFYRSRPPRIRFTGLLEELVEPRAEYLIEEQSSEAIRADQVGSGQSGDEEE